MSRITIEQDGTTLRVAARTAEAYVGRGWTVVRSDKRGATAWERHCVRRKLTPWPPKKATKKSTGRS